MSAFLAIVTLNHMKSSILSLTAICLLLCPLRCAVLAQSAAAGGSGVASAKTCCSHCGHSASIENKPQRDADPRPAGSDNSQPLNHPSESDCGCRACICKGAMNESASGPSIRFDAPSFLATAVIPRLELRKSSSLDACGARQDAGFASGRTARIALQSLLI